MSESVTTLIPEKYSKPTMTLNLSEREMKVLEELAERQDLSKTAVMRQALRHYQFLTDRLRQGHRMFWKDAEDKEIIEVVFGCMGDD